jgi:Tol biopolymer transport system component
MKRETTRVGVAWGWVGRAIVIAATVLASTMPARADELLFTSNRDDGIFQLFRMDLAGGTARRVLAHSMQAAQLSASPDGRQLLFISSVKSQPDLFLVNLGDNSLRQLTSDMALETSPRWLPDGKRVVFQSFRDGSPRLYTMNTDGTNIRRLTDGDKGEESAPSVSPDGTRVAYTLTTGRRTSQIRIVDIATGKSVAVGVEPAKGDESGPQWSPDGQSIAYARNDGTAGHIVTARADGTNKQTLTTGAADRNDLPQWSPDGRRIAYLSMKKPSNRQAVYVMDADGRNAQELSGGDEEHLSVAWAPAGDSVIFVKFQQGRGQIFSRSLREPGSARLSGGQGYDLEFAIAAKPVVAQVAQAR